MAESILWGNFESKLESIGARSRSIPFCATRDIFNKIIKNDVTMVVLTVFN